MRAPLGINGAGRGNTSWESNGSNNEKTVTYTVEFPLKIEFVTPNALYRENTDVVTSFLVKNPSDVDYDIYHSASVRFTASSGGTTLYTTLKTIMLVPAYGENLAYFKWKVSSGLNGATVTLKADVIRAGVIMDTVTKTHGSEVRVTSQTPDTQYEKSKPAGFSYLLYKSAGWDAADDVF